MRLDISELVHAPIGTTLVFQVQWGFQDLDDELSVEDIRGQLTFIQTDKGILGSGTLAVNVDTECARCLEPIRKTIDIEMEERFRPVSSISPQNPACPIDSEGCVELRPVFRDLVLVALPMNPLCKNTCKGLCPNCGHNLNEGPCACSAEEVDPRLAALELLLRGMEQDE